MDYPDKEVVPTCEKCGSNDAMILQDNGERVCHHTCPTIEDGIHAVAVEDLITIVCETFVGNLQSLGYDEHNETKSLYEWYMKDKDDAGRRDLSDRLLDILEGDMERVRQGECQCEEDGHCNCDADRVCSCRT